MKTKLLPIILLSTFTGACDRQPSQKEIATQRGAEMAASVDVTSNNAEQKNIQLRLKLTSQPGLLGYIVLLNESGDPVLYTTVKGKITSSGKRLTQPWQRTYEGRTAPAPSDEGTWGSSDPYIYFWDQGGRYHQWSGEYLYSDQPIRLTRDPLVAMDDVAQETSQP